MQMLLGLPVAADDSAGPLLQLSNKSLRNTKWHGSFENEMTIYYYVMWTVWIWCVAAPHSKMSAPKRAARICFAFILFRAAIKL